MQKLFQKILIFLAKMYLWRYQPTIIAVTGNVGKSSTRDAIAAVMRSKGSVRVGVGSINNLFGVPLTILSDDVSEYLTAGGTPWFWFKTLLFSKLRLLTFRPYPQYVVLEYGADHPGDIKQLAHLFPPHVGVVTAVGDVPVHVEYFSDPDQLANEKSHLVHAIKSGGHAILNQDDDAVLAMKDKTTASVVTFGFGDHAGVRISNYEISFDEHNRPEGVTFKLHCGGSFVPVKLYGSLGKSQAYAAAAAAAVGVALNMNLVDISAALGSYQGPNGRLKILKGIKDTIILDDTYNASPAAMHIAFETLRDVAAPRRIAVLGDMLELGRYTADAHQTVGNLAGSIANILVCVGDKGRLIADAAANQLPQENIFWFETSDEAKSKVQELIQPGDVVLVKGSQGKRMEKIVKEIMAQPEKASDLLVRQSVRWLEK